MTTTKDCLIVKRYKDRMPQPLVVSGKVWYGTEAAATKKANELNKNRKRSNVVFIAEKY